MARGDITGAALRREYAKTLAVLDQAFDQAAVNVAKKAVVYEGKKATKRAIVNTYSTSVGQLWAASMNQSFRGLGDDTANALLKGAQAIQRATIGDTKAAQRDNEEIEEVMRVFAERINTEILEQYLEEFSGRSYRESDPSRRSGGIERYLRKKTVARPIGHNVEVSLQSAVGDDDVPHIFRLNYGTRSLVGGEKAGVRAPVFKISMVPGAPSLTKDLAGRRRPGFRYPGKAFKFSLTLGSAGQVQLYGGEPAGRRIGFGTETRPSRGIAPSYFVEYGLTEATKQFPRDMKALIDRWKRRAARISGDVSKL